MIKVFFLLLFYSLHIVKLSWTLVKCCVMGKKEEVKYLEIVPNKLLFNEIIIIILLFAIFYYLLYNYRFPKKVPHLLHVKWAIYSHCINKSQCLMWL